MTQEIQVPLLIIPGHESLEVVRKEDYDALLAENDALATALKAAAVALQSYACGNTAPELAAEVVAHISTLLV